MIPNTEIQLAFHEKNMNIPIWIMRQAGRYLPEYKKVRSSVKDFLELCYSPEKAAKVTMQPVNRFDLDAAIIFSDILVLPNALGIDIRFEDQIGPILESLTSPEKITKFLNAQLNFEKLEAVYEAIRLVRNKLKNTKSLIGFAGGPWTVATYLIEGRGKTNLETIKLLNWQNPECLRSIINTLTHHTITHLKRQILAGADVIQIFDSTAGYLLGEDFFDYVISPTAEIVKSIKQEFKHVKIIGFPKGASTQYHDYVRLTQVDGVSCDYNLPLSEMSKLSVNTLVQGNLDPMLLLSNNEIIRKKTEYLLKSFNKCKFIFNLGHGILPNTNPETVEYLVNFIKNYDRKLSI